MPTISCPACGTAEQLAGIDTTEGKRISCERCGHRWTRDLTPTCRLCGSTDLEAVPTATLEEAGRGTMRTPSGIRDAYRCFGCGARDATSSSPLPAEDGPQARPPRTIRHTDVDRATTTAAPTQPGRVESEFGVFSVGQVVGGRWRLARLLRWSPPTSLWRAVEVEGSRAVTFKLFAPAALSEFEAKVRVAAGRAAGTVTHPHLLRILDVQRRRRHVLIAAEAVDGVALADAGPLPGDDLLTVAAGCSDALAAMHEQGVAHLDIGPSKLLVTGAGPARLINFGSGLARSRLRAGPPEDAELQWWAPEQVVSDQHPPAADVYSLALTLWVAAGGRLARFGPNAAAQAGTRLQQDLPPLSEVVDDVPSRLTNAVAAAGRRRPQDRVSARELAALLAGGQVVGR